MGTLMKVEHKVLKKGIHVMTSPFGMRTLKGVTKLHKGIDFVSNSKADGSGYSMCDEITAFADGVVQGVLDGVFGSSPSTGNYVILTHAQGWQTVYFHLKKGSVCVKKGDAVKAGDVIGYMGATGNVTGAHLHFGIRKDGTYVDPAPYLEGTTSLPEEEEAQTVTVSLPVLKKGSKGAAVKSLQRLLKSMGYKDANGKSLSLDGSFGAKTEHALKKFRGDRGLPQNGVCDGQCWAALLT